MVQALHEVGRRYACSWYQPKLFAGNDTAGKVQNPENLNFFILVVFTLISCANERFDNNRLLAGGAPNLTAVLAEILHFHHCDEVVKIANFDAVYFCV